MMLYARLLAGQTPGNTLGDRIALGTKANSRFTVAELLPSDKSTHCRLVVHDTAQGTIYGAKVDIKTDAQDAYLLGPEAGQNAGLRDDGTAALFTMMPEFMAGEKFKTAFEHWTEGAKGWLTGGSIDDFVLNIALFIARSRVAEVRLKAVVQLEPGKTVRQLPIRARKPVVSCRLP